MTGQEATWRARQEDFEYRGLYDGEDDDASPRLSCWQYLVECLTSHAFACGACLVLVVLAAAGERVSFKVLLDVTLPYRLLVLVILLFVVFLVCSAIVVYKRLYTDEIPNEVCDFAKSRFLFMAVLDLMQNSLLFVAGGAMPAALTVLLAQGTVPLFLVTNLALTGCKARCSSGARDYRVSGFEYSNGHYLGAVIIAAGCCVGVLPVVLNGSGDYRRSGSGDDDFSAGLALANVGNTSSALSAKAGATGGVSDGGSGGSAVLPLSPSTPSGATFLCCLLYVLAGLFNALSSTYKMHALRLFPHRIDMFYLSAWTSALQLLLAIPLSPLLFHLLAWTQVSDAPPPPPPPPTPLSPSLYISLTHSLTRPLNHFLPSFFPSFFPSFLPNALIHALACRRRSRGDGRRHGDVRLSFPFVGRDQIHSYKPARRPQLHLPRESAPSSAHLRLRGQAAVLSSPYGAARSLCALHGRAQHRASVCYGPLRPEARHVRCSRRRRPRVRHA